MAKALLKEAESALVADDWREATQKADSALEECRKGKDAKGFCQALRARTLAEIGLGRATQALAQCEVEAKRMKDTKNKVGEASVMMSLAEAQLAIGDPEAANATAVKAQVVFMNDGDTTKEAETLLLIARARVQHGVFPSAQKSANEALELFKEEKDEAGQAEAWRILAGAQDENSVEEALNASDKASALYKKVGDKKGEATMMNVSARFICAHRSTKQGLRFASQARRLFQELGSKKGDLDALTTIVEAHFSQDQYTEALSLLKREVYAFQEDGYQPGEAASGVWLAAAYKALGDTEKAVTWANKAEKLYKALQDKKGLQQVQLAKYDLFFAAQNYDGALRAGHELLKICRQLGDKTGMKDAERLITEASTYLGDVEDCPNRGEALEILNAFVGSVENEDEKTFKRDLDRLSELGGGLVHADFEEAFKDLLESDRAKTERFLKKHADLDLGEQGAPRPLYPFDPSTAIWRTKLRVLEMAMFYYMYKAAGGIGYGPSFRTCKMSTKIWDERQSYIILGHHEDQPDWVKKMQYPAGIIDGGFQAGFTESMQMGDSPPIPMPVGE